MPCYHPLSGYVSRTVNESGKRSIVFDVKLGFSDKPVQLPCGRCIGCRLERARQWSVRCMHEASLHDKSVFVTLTYDDAHLPLDGSLRPRDFVLFMKRLRKHLSFEAVNPASGRFKRYYRVVRYFQCGEYGEKTCRPHHHAILFNVDFADKRSMSNALGPSRLYHSDTLDNLWRNGYCTIGMVTRESAGYVARYSLKKVTGEWADDWYAGRLPEYCTMSRKPGIGAGWFVKWHRDISPRSELVVDGVEVKLPRFYDKMLESQDSRRFRALRREREKQRKRNEANDSGSRLIVRENVTKAAVKQLTRGLE